MIHSPGTYYPAARPCLYLFGANLASLAVEALIGTGGLVVLLSVVVLFGAAVAGIIEIMTSKERRIGKLVIIGSLVWSTLWMLLMGAVLLMDYGTFEIP